MLEGVEADDVISYVVGHSQYQGWQKVIVSSDKDFIQLLNEETILLRPTQKQIMTSKTVLEDYGISTENFVLARAIAGDNSDNLKGVPRAGLTTVSKRLPFLSENKRYDLGSVYDYCSTQESKIKFFANVQEYFDLVRRNYKVMNLTPPSISPQGKGKISYALQNFDFSLNATRLKTISIENGFAHFDWSELIAMMRKISKDY